MWCCVSGQLCFCLHKFLRKICDSLVAKYSNMSAREPFFSLLFDAGQVVYNVLFRALLLKTATDECSMNDRKQHN